MAPPRNKLILNVDLVSPWSLVGLTVARRYVQQWNLDLVVQPRSLHFVRVIAKSPIQLNRPENIEKWAAHEQDRAGPFFGVPFVAPKVFPINTYVPIAFLTHLSDHPTLSNLVTDTFEALSKAQWYEQKSIVEVEEVKEIIKHLFEDEKVMDELFAKAALPETKTRLKADAKVLVDQGAFGFPWIEVTRGLDGKTAYYFGSDRFERIAGFLHRPWLGPYGDGRVLKL